MEPCSRSFSDDRLITLLGEAFGDGRPTAQEQQQPPSAQRLADQLPRGLRLLLAAMAIVITIPAGLVLAGMLGLLAVGVPLFWLDAVWRKAGEGSLYGLIALGAVGVVGVVLVTGVGARQAVAILGLLTLAGAGIWVVAIGLPALL